VTTLIKNRDLRSIAIGMRVRKAAAQLPQGAAGNIFTITGGRIKVVQLIGEVTTALDANAATIKAGYTPSAAGTSLGDWSIASAAMASAIVGVHLWLPAAAGSALATDIGAPKGAGGIVGLVSYLVPAGAVTLTTVGSNIAGRVQWDLYYIPVDSSARVVAA
jgi:hypothetical protein